jgi:signal transduction histidine kinase
VLRLSSVRARMTAAVTVLFAAWVALVGAGLFAYLYYSAERNATRALDLATREVTTDISEEARHLGAAELPTSQIIRVVDEEAKEGGLRGLAPLVVGPDGKAAWRLQQGTPPWPPRGADWRFRSVSAGGNTVVLGLDWGQVRGTLRQEAAALLCLGLFTIAAVALASWALVGRTLSPIGSLSRHAREASVDELRVRLQAPSNDAEITELVATLNGLLERIADTAAAKGRFYAAASHELRTPLQALSGHLEVALSRPRREDEYRAAIGEALSQTRRLTRLAQDLLLLNQLDSASPVQSREPVDLAEVCERTLRQVQPIIAPRGLRLSTEDIAEAAVLAPPAHVDILARNLVENAVRYAASGGEVRLSVRDDAEGATLTVFNECPPIPEWDPASSFEAFAWPDRARRAAAGGHGLGLAICGAIARANQWTLTLDHDGRGVLATVVFRGDNAREEPRR